MRFTLAVIVALLAFSASGVSSLIAAEPCAAYELTGEGEDNGGCPPTCVTCGCCAQATEPAVTPVANAPDVPVMDVAEPRPGLPIIEPHPILHVPKFRSA